MYPARSVSVFADHVRLIVPAVAGGLTVNETGSVLLVAPVAETIMVPLYVPALSPVRVTAAATVPVLVPDAGERLSHAALSPAVQASVPVPVLEIVKDCAAGLDAPDVPVNVRLGTFRLITGLDVGAGLSVSETGMTCGVLAAPLAEIVTAAVYVPAAKPVVFTVAEMESVSVVVMPEPVESVSQAAFSLVVHDKVLPLGFVRLISCAVGAVPPTTAEKLSALGLSEMVGVEVFPLTVRDTGIAV